MKNFLQENIEIFWNMEYHQEYSKNRYTIEK